MAKVTIYDMTGKSVGERELNDAIFAVTPNKAVLHEVVKNYLANQRQGTQSTLPRTEVSGGGKKPWRQKGTGHARQGSTRAPQWTHGGVALGPKPRSYRYTLNRKMKVVGLKSALSAKGADAIMTDYPDFPLPERARIYDVETAHYLLHPDRGGAAGMERSFGEPVKA